ncbi:hypothetical protein L1049_027194 [Liquidambar formosana]|uniref:Uncharacterized protein n=1 Tax=Liquidambar formosana TaxID=63359 RepID=A0AAP0N5G4_LIQFO
MYGIYSHVGDENNALILKILKNQNSGELGECAENQAKLQQNLMYLAAIADCQPQPTSMHAQLNIFPEEIIRAGSAASLSSLLNRLDPVLRKTANLGRSRWICQNKSYGQPTILVAKSVKGEEEILDGTVAVLTPNIPDVLSHVSVRARNSKICFATCFDPDILADLRAREGRLLCLKPTSADVVYRLTKEHIQAVCKVVAKSCEDVKQSIRWARIIILVDYLTCKFWIGLITFDMSFNMNYSSARPNFTELAEFIAHELEVSASQSIILRLTEHHMQLPGSFGSYQLVEGNVHPQMKKIDVAHFIDAFAMWTTPPPLHCHLALFQFWRHRQPAFGSYKPVGAVVPEQELQQL